MGKTEDRIADFFVYFLIWIGVLGMIYGEGWNILFYSIAFILGLWLLIYKTKQGICS